MATVLTMAQLQAKFTAVDTASAKYGNAATALRNAKIDAYMTINSCQIAAPKIFNNTSISDANKAKQAKQADWGKIAPISNQAVGYANAAGLMLNLPGELDESVGVSNLVTMVSIVGSGKVEEICRVSGMTTQAAYDKIKEIFDTKKAEKKAGADTVAKQLKSADGPITKALDYADEMWLAADRLTMDAMILALVTRRDAMNGTTTTLTTVDADPAADTADVDNVVSISA